MSSQYSDSAIARAIQTLESIKDVIIQLIEWNNGISSSDDYYTSQNGLKLLAANCTLITAIGEGVNRINRLIPGFLQSEYPLIPWQAIIGMRNHIAHGYFELDAELIYETIVQDIPPLLDIVTDAVFRLGNRSTD